MKASVVIALGGVHRLRAADLLGGLAEELQRAFEAELLHRRFGREHARERGGAERRVRVGMPGGPGMQPRPWRLVGHHLLRVAGHRVVFGIAPEHRAALAP